MSRGIPSLGQWSISGQTQTQGTIITQGIPPWPSSGSRFLYNRSSKNWLTCAGGGGAITHVTSLVYTTSSTDLKKPTLMSPLNWTYITTAAAAGATTVTLFDDPGAYSTNFRYPLGGGAAYPYNAADNLIATNDWIAFQLADGTWWWAKVTVAGLVMTISALPSPTGTGNVVLAGTPCFWYGIVTDTDPSTGMAHKNFQPQASATDDVYDFSGLYSGVHPGDPLLFYDANATSAATLVTMAGYFGKF